MTAREVASHFKSKKTGKGEWIALCPAHGERHASLSIREGKSAVLLCCWSNRCDVQSIVESVGLRVQDLFYASIADPKAIREARRRREVQDAKERDLRIGKWILRFTETGYTRGDYKRDIAVVCACAQVLSNKSSQTWESLLNTHLERIAAAYHCKERGMLPRKSPQDHRRSEPDDTSSPDLQPSSESSSETPTVYQLRF